MSGHGGHTVELNEADKVTNVCTSGSRWQVSWNKAQRTCKTCVVALGKVVFLTKLLITIYI